MAFPLFLGSKIFVPHSPSPPFLPDENDLKAICFVCNIDRFTADQKGIGFDKHVKLEHYPKVMSSMLQDKNCEHARAWDVGLCGGLGARGTAGSSLDSDRILRTHQRASGICFS
jgi:hypothetical protein